MSDSDEEYPVEKIFKSELRADGRWFQVSWKGKKWKGRKDWIPLTNLANCQDLLNVSCETGIVIPFTSDLSFLHIHRKSIDLL